MKTRNLYPLLSSLFLFGLLSACQKDDPKPTPPSDSWTQEELMGVLENHRWRVESVFRTTSAGTTDLSTDNTFAYKDYIAYRKTPVFWFRQGFVVFYSSQKITNSQFADSVETVSISQRITYPTGARYQWDDAKKNVVLYTDSSTYSLQIPAGKTAFLDKTSIQMYKTIEEAKAARVHENLTVISEETDPVAGRITYTFNLKPLWQYGGAGDLQQTYYYAIF